jgi:hypothetical protein
LVLVEIEARLKAATPDIDDMTRVSKGAIVGLDYILDDGYNPILAPEAQKFIDHAPTDIAALLQRVRELEAEKAKVINWIDSEVERLGNNCGSPIAQDAYDSGGIAALQDLRDFITKQ